MSKINRQNRKRHSNRIKFQIALEALRGDKSQAEIAREYGINANLISHWKEQFLEKGPTIFDSGKNNVEQQQNKKIQELERIIGKQTVEISLLKKFLGHYHSD